MAKQKQLEYPLNVVVDCMFCYAIGEQLSDEEEEKARLEAIEKYRSDALLPATFEYVLACALSGQELRLVHLYHRDNLTMAQAAEVVGVSHSRVGQILHKAWRKLRQNCYRTIVSEGITNYYGDKTERECQKAYKKGYDEGYNVGYKAALADKPKVALEDVPHIPLEKFEPSIRLYNTLKRNGINTLYDVAKTDPEVLVGFKMLGTKTIEELIGILEEYSVDTTGIKDALRHKQLAANNHQ